MRSPPFPGPGSGAVPVVSVALLGAAGLGVGGRASDSMILRPANKTASWTEMNKFFVVSEATPGHT